MQAVQVAPAGARSHRRPAGAAQLERAVGHEVLAAAGRRSTSVNSILLRGDLDDPHVGHVQRARLGEPDLQAAGRADVARGAEHGLVLLPRRAHRELVDSPLVSQPLVSWIATLTVRLPTPWPASGRRTRYRRSLTSLTWPILGEHGVAVAAAALAARADQPGKRLAVGVLLDAQSLGHVGLAAGGGPLLGLAVGCLREIAVGDEVGRLGGLSHRHRRKGQEEKQDGSRHCQLSF